jgi:hypothetical protein
MARRIDEARSATTRWPSTSAIIPHASGQSRLQVVFTKVRADIELHAPKRAPVRQARIGRREVGLGTEPMRRLDR